MLRSGPQQLFAGCPVEVSCNRSESWSGEQVGERVASTEPVLQVQECLKAGPVAKLENIN